MASERRKQYLERYAKEPPCFNWRPREFPRGVTAGAFGKAGETGKPRRRRLGVYV